MTLKEEHVYVEKHLWGWIKPLSIHIKLEVFIFVSLLSLSHLSMSIINFLVKSTFLKLMEKGFQKFKFFFFKNTYCLSVSICTVLNPRHLTKTIYAHVILTAKENRDIWLWFYLFQQVFLFHLRFTKSRKLMTWFSWGFTDSFHFFLPQH